ncbi:hypothetical protein [Aquimarina algiphila]|uniref:Uncharacterized protein n=1 Tax=Aquimarina algiphila TaxID=2047982 RepID=A0A554VAQ3_9FLAO|nr:hypothetical protein [Aquimarina algiphila]TSE03348.1 hypothetical protein FOF46_29545 [Aquimarina algiphila]
MEIIGEIKEIRDTPRGKNKVVMINDLFTGGSWCVEFRFKELLNQISKLVPGDKIKLSTYNVAKVYKRHYNNVIIARTMEHIS